MTRILWDQEGEKLYSTGVDRGVLYVHNGTAYGTGEGWNGLTSFQVSSDGGDAEAIYADNIKYLNLVATEDKKGTIKCYTYPDGWDECNGLRKVDNVLGLRIGQQVRRTFGFTCRTLIGNDTDGTDYGYKLWIVYGATASPSDEEYQTVNDNPEAIEFSYEFNTTPVDTGVAGLKPCAIFEIVSTDFQSDAEKAKLTALENILYGDADHQPTLPTVAQIIETLSSSPTPTTYKLTLTQGDDTTLTVMKGTTAMANNDDISVGDVLTISATATTGTATITVNGEAFTSGNTFTVAGNTVVVSAKAE